MKRVLIAIALLLAFVVPAFAFEGGQPSQGTGPGFEQRKSEVLDNLNKRIQRLQDETACVQAATNHQDLKDCLEKFRVMEREEMKERRGGHGGRDDQTGSHRGQGGQNSE